MATSTQQKIQNKITTQNESKIRYFGMKNQTENESENV